MNPENLVAMGNSLAVEKRQSPDVEQKASSGGITLIPQRSLG